MLHQAQCNQWQWSIRRGKTKREAAGVLAFLCVVGGAGKEDIIAIAPM